MINPKVYIIVLNWNMWRDTVECIESVKRLNYDNYKILIVDNASTDESVKVLKEHFPDIEIIRNEQNTGFAGGNNTGMRYALQKGADYIFILNNDVVLGVACLSELIGVAEGRLEAGMLAPKVYYYDEPQAINSFGTAIDWFRLRPYLGYCGQKDNGQFTGIRYVDILVGCALLVKKETLNRIGLIDERFFIFHEEADWCLRNIKSGFKNVTVGKAIAYHKASRTMRNFTALTTYYSIRNFLYLAHKNASFVNRIKTFFGCSFLIFKNILLLIFNSRAQRNPKAFLLGILDYLRADMGICKRKL